MLKIVIGFLMAWAAIDTAMLDAALGWPKWLLVPAFVAFGFGFFVAGLVSRGPDHGAGGVRWARPGLTFRASSSAPPPPAGRTRPRSAAARS